MSSNKINIDGEQLKKNIEECDNLIGAWNQKLILTQDPTEERRCEVEIENLKRKRDRFEQELEKTLNELNLKELTGLINETKTSLKKPKFVKILIIAIIIIGAIGLTKFYMAWVSPTSGFDNNKIDTMQTNGKTIDSTIVAPPLCKAPQITIKTSLAPCDSHNYGKFPTGKVCLNIRTNKALLYKLKIDWGDNSEDILTPGNSNCYSIFHTYSSIREKVIKVYFVCTNNKLIYLDSKKIIIQSL